MFVNLTPHDLTLVHSNGDVRVFPKSGKVARAGEAVSDLSGDWRIPVAKKQFTAPEGLPEQQPGVWLLVSSMVAESADWREDLLVPDTGPQSVVRNEKGQILGVKRFYRAR